MENEPIFTYCLNCGKPLEQSLGGFKPRKPASGKGTSGCSLVAIRADGGTGEEYPLADGVNTVGTRGPEVVIRDDPRVDAEHATLDIGRDIAFLEDLNTIHGTYVRVSGQRPLADGDRLRIGHALFEYRVSSQVPPTTGDGSALLGSLGTPNDHYGRLLRLGPDDVPFEAFLLRPPEVFLGRSTGDILLADDPFVSSKHASFTWTGSGCVLKDAGSTNGCYFRIRGRTAVRDGDFVLVGHHLFQFHRAQEA